MALYRALAKLVLLALAMMISACSIYSLPGQTPAPVEKEPEYSVVTPAPESAPMPSVTTPTDRAPDAGSVAAYGPLLDRADAATAKGDYEEALALLERAQRIDPDSAEVYLAMARTHGVRGDAAQARASAERGLLYCSGQTQCDALRKFTR